MSCRADRPLPKPKGVLGVLTAGHKLEWDRLRPGPRWDGLFPILRRMLSIQPEDRYRDMLDVAEDLRRLIPPSAVEWDERPTEDSIDHHDMTLLSAESLMFDGQLPEIAADDDDDEDDATRIDTPAISREEPSYDEDAPTQLGFTSIKRNVA